MLAKYGNPQVKKEMSFQDLLEKRAGRSGGSPTYQCGEYTVLKINAQGKKVGWYVRKGSMKNDRGPFKTLRAAVASVK